MPFRKLLLILPVTVLAALAPAAAASAQTTCANANTAPTSANVEAIRTAVLCLVNEQRAQRALPALAANAQLTAAAQGHSDDMVAKRYFSHTSADGRTFAARISASGYLTGYRTYSIGENIAYGTGSSGTPQQIVTNWMNSAGHRANILNASFRHSGIGVNPGVPVSGYGAGGTYTHDFGMRS
jgi:uncharacterized protein YkwD